MFEQKITTVKKDLILKDCGFIFILILARILWQGLRR